MVRAHFTYANVMATVAVFIALGGSSYAAIRITGNNVVDSSLRGDDVKNGSLDSRDVRNLRAKDFVAGQLRPGPRGAQGHRGPRGFSGDRGPPGVQGYHGTRGPQGASGSPGPAGTSGATGPVGPPGPAGEDFAVFQRRIDGEVVTGTTGQIHDFGGPSVEVDVPANGLVQLFYLAHVRSNASTAADATCANTGANRARLYLHEPTDFPNGVVIAGAAGSGYQERLPSRQFGARIGSWLVLPATPGRRTYSLRYGADQNCQGFFKNRHLWVGPARSRPAG